MGVPVEIKNIQEFNGRLLLQKSVLDPNSAQVGFKLQNKPFTGTNFNQNTSFSSGSIIPSVHTSHSLNYVKHKINNSAGLRPHKFL
jgi:hypothetical protein